MVFKVGVTKTAMFDPNGRVAKLRRQGFHTLHDWCVADMRTARRAERAVLRFVRTCGAKPADVRMTYGGVTETFYGDWQDTDFFVQLVSKAVDLASACDADPTIDASRACSRAGATDNDDDRPEWLQRLAVDGPEWLYRYACAVVDGANSTGRTEPQLSAGAELWVEREVHAARKAINERPAR